MSTQPKTNKPKFWLVFFGLIVLISLIGGGTYALNEAGLLGSSTMSEGDRNAPSGFSAGELPDGATFTPPEGFPDRDDGGTSSIALLGLGKSVGQLALVIAAVNYAQKLSGWLEKRRQKPKLSGQAG